MDSFVDVYKETLLQIPTQLKKGNLMGCCVICSDLTKLSATFQSKEHVFISEFLEYLFTNLRETSTNYDMSEETTDEITLAVVNFINELITFVVAISTNESRNMDEDKIKIYNHMRDLRYLVTNVQYTNRMTKSPSRKQRLLFE